ncbi:MAG: GMC family oxidoreductase [Gammaproteobacteria bacterium]|nr:GMC family oxidoreductase [Gammaproteobacteria bacterium]
MYTDIDNLPSGTTATKNLCIIGAGAAGISLAREFLSQPDVSIALVESGAFNHEGSVQKLYEGEFKTNTPLEAQLRKNYLHVSRTRQFGGSTNCWSGWCVPLSPWDFKQRPWIPYSGWPITREQMDPYYDRATEVLGVTPFNYDLGDHKERLGPEFIKDSEKFDTQILHHAEQPARFNTLYRDDITGAANIELFLHANVTSIRTLEDNSRIDYIDAVSLSGKRIRVHADIFVLCAGGIENPRILLANQDDFPRGIGNEYDLVGRFFMEHIRLLGIAELMRSRPQNPVGMYYGRWDALSGGSVGPYVIGVLCLSEAAQIEQQVYNCALYLNSREVPKSDDRYMRKSKLFNAVSQLDNYPEYGNRNTTRGSYLGGLRCRTEQMPNPKSRVTLSNWRDPLGVPKVKLNWQMQKSDWNNVYRSLETLGHELGRLSEGRLRITMDQSNPENVSYSGYHHMGTTRMSNSPKKGVVDENCRVHSIKNLYVGGSSVFSTSGWANPTFTITALALRLADHLKQRYFA